MTAEDAGGRAGRVEQDRIDGLYGGPLHDVTLDDLGGETRAFQILI